MPTNVALVDFRAKPAPAAELAAVAAALTRQAVEHFAEPPPAGWGVSALVVACTPTTVEPGDWVLGLFDHPDQPGALGYHDRTRAGLPLMKVFPALCQQDGVSWSSCASHELLETLADPETCRAAQDKAGSFWALEVCLSPETRVRLADGSEPTIETLAQHGGMFNVCAMDAAGRPVIAQGGDARKTGRNLQTVRVQFTDGTFVRCTPEHRFLIAPAMYAEAKTLRAGQSLFSEMIPTGAAPGSINRAEGNAESRRQGVSAFRALANLFNRSIRQFGLPVRLADSVPVASHATLGGGVDHVRSMRAEEQVIRIAAARTIALMADLKAIGNRTAVQFVREAVRVVHLLLETQLAIPAIVLGPEPVPAGLGLLNARPENLLQRRLPLVVRSESGMDAAVSTLPRPVGRAEPLRPNGSTTSRNRALFGHAKVVASVERADKTDVFDLTVPGVHNFMVAGGAYVHNCDAVEADTYSIDGVEVSNFVTPIYFEPPRTRARAKFDYLGKVKTPFALRPGGYNQMFVPGQGWTQKTADVSRPYRTIVQGRRGARAAKFTP